MKKFRLVSLLLILMLVFQSFSVFAEGNRPEKSYESWSTVAEYIGIVLDESIAAYEAGEAKQAKDLINEAYFGHYEVDGFEKTVLANISGKRVSLVEAYFHKAKKLTRENVSLEEYKECVLELKKMILEDGATLDSMRSGSSDEKSEEAATEGETAQDSATSKSGQQQSQIKWTTFLTSFVLVLREGLEAILIVVAILAYLDKSNQKRFIRPVYYGALIGIIFSIIMAWAFSLIKDVTTAQISREVFEGIGFFVAAVVLFFVSNWMLSKSEVESWNLYIQGQVEKSLTKGSVFTLAFTAFLAVSREGAELILFFQGIAGHATYDDTFMWVGIGVATVVLGIIWVLVRQFSVKLPLKPFFYATSTLMYMLAIIFVGKGVFELQEADWIGRTYIFGTDYDLFQVDWLGIYDRYETMLPQIGLILLAVISFVWYVNKNKKIRETLEAKTGSSQPQAETNK